MIKKEMSKYQLFKTDEDEIIKKNNGESRIREIREASRQQEPPQSVLESRETVQRMVIRSGSNACTLPTDDPYHRLARDSVCRGFCRVAI